MPPPGDVAGHAQPTADRDANASIWAAAVVELAGLPKGRGLNIAYEAVDRHALGSRAQHVALRWLGARGERRDISYAELAAQSNRFANALCSLGLAKGDRIFVLTDRIPELYTAVLGALKNGCVVCTLFSAFGPEPIAQRIGPAKGRLLVTTPSLYRRKVAALRSQLPDLEHVLLAGVRADAEAESGGDLPEGTKNLSVLLEASSDVFKVPATDPNDPALLHFTSGTTGRPKGVVHAHRAITVHRASAQTALDLRPEDIYWCTADPGWVTGTSYGIVAPLSLGVTSIIDEGSFDAERWYRVLQDEGVTVWYTAPTAIRMLMKAGPELRARFDLSRLRFIASVGEPLNPEAVIWGRDVLGLPIHDNWWQTETGGIMLANTPDMEIRPGSMGRPLPGIEAAIAGPRSSDAEDVAPGAPLELLEGPDAEGELVLRAGWPSMFSAYLDMDERYRASFRDGWYLSGDLVRRDADGYFWFVGRSDDVIKTAGHLVGPFEVENALMEHPAVAEAAMIGIPDELAGNLIKAFVSLRAGHAPSEELRRDLMAHARRRLGPAVAPREIAFLDDLPKTRSGKIMRRVLRARELGLDEGDLSTLESPQ